MSDCCPRADGYHGPNCVEWWERAYGSEYDERKKAESQVSSLTASLASMTKERDMANWRADSNFENYEYEKQQRVATQFELAELRKRMGEAREAVVEAAEAMDYGLEQSHDAFLNRALHLLASPPSPAPEATEKLLTPSVEKIKAAFATGHAPQPSPAPVESKPKDAAWACEKHTTFGPSYLKCSFCADEKTAALRSTTRGK